MATKDEELKPTYAGTYDKPLSELYEKITSRPKFEYSVDADPLYQQYKDQYIQQGKLAMKDTMGQAAALTGGYGSTYGQQVGQQTYDAYLQNLSAVIPELYGMAYDMYQDEGDQLLKQYGMLGEMRDTEYGRYRDELSDWNIEREYQRQLEDTDYTRRTEEEKEAYRRRMAEEETAYQREQDEYKRRTAEDESRYARQQQAYANLYALIKASGYSPSDAELAAAGMTREAADALAQEYLRSIEPVYSGGGGGGGYSGGGGYYGGYYGDEDDYEPYNYTFGDVARAYDVAKSGGHGRDASRLLGLAQREGIIDGDDRRRIFKDWQVKDRL